MREEDEVRDPAELDAPGATLAPQAGGTASGGTAGAGEPGVDPAASGGEPDPDGQRRTEMTTMGVPGATGGGPQKLAPEEQAEERLASALDDPTANAAEVTDPGLGATGATGAGGESGD